MCDTMIIKYQGHIGEQNKGDIKVKFYGIEFFNILQAINMLRDVKPGNFYEIYYKKQKIIVNETEMKYYYNDAWWIELEDVKSYINSLVVNPLNIFESAKIWQEKVLESPIPSRLSKMEWLEMKEEEEEEREFAANHCKDEPWLFCKACEVGVCECH